MATRGLRSNHGPKATPTSKKKSLYFNNILNVSTTHSSEIRTDTELLASVKSSRVLLAKASALAGFRGYDRLLLAPLYWKLFRGFFPPRFFYRRSDQTTVTTKAMMVEAKRFRRFHTHFSSRCLVYRNICELMCRVSLVILFLTSENSQTSWSCCFTSYVHPDSFFSP